MRSNPVSQDGVKTTKRTTLILLPKPLEKHHDAPGRDKPGKTQKYNRPAGVSPRLFVPPRLDLNEPEIWITEGEFKPLAGWAHGLPVCALAGVWNWRRNIDESDPEIAAAKLAGAGGEAGCHGVPI